MNFELKYEPRSLDDYVFASDKVEQLIRGYVTSSEHRHLIFHGLAGTGKTNLSKLIPTAMAPDVSPHDVLFLNASLDNKVEIVRNKIRTFAKVTGLNSRGLRWIILDECEQMTSDSQKSLKGLLEEVAKHVMVIMTTNEVWKIIDPIKDRCEVMSIVRPDAEQMLRAAKRILTAEDETISDELLLKCLTDQGADPLTRVTVSYREMCRRLEKIVRERRARRNTSSGVALPPASNTSGSPNQ